MCVCVSPPATECAGLAGDVHSVVVLLLDHVLGLDLQLVQLPDLVLQKVLELNLLPLELLHFRYRSLEEERRRGEGEERRKRRAIK